LRFLIAVSRLILDAGGLKLETRAGREFGAESLKICD
jgi:hypothetical protein